jgi:hypothetical protein
MLCALSHLFCLQCENFYTFKISKIRIFYVIKFYYWANIETYACWLRHRAPSVRSCVYRCASSIRCFVFDIMNTKRTGEALITHRTKELSVMFAHLQCGHAPNVWSTRWFKYDRDDLCVNKSQFVPVIFEPLCKSCPITGLDKPLGLQEVEAPRISRQLVHEGGNFVSPTHRPPLPHREDSWYSFLLQAVSTPGS